MSSFRKISQRGGGIASRSVRLPFALRGTGGQTGMEDAINQGASGVAVSNLAWDTTQRRFGRIGREAFGFDLDADDEMSAFLLQRNTHDPSPYGRYVGDCAAFDMTPWVSDDSVVLVMLIMAGGNTLPAAQLTYLQSWGLWNDSSTAARTLGATDYLAFAGVLNMEQGTAYEIRATANDIILQTQLMGPYLS